MATKKRVKKNLGGPPDGAGVIAMATRLHNQDDFARAPSPDDHEG